MGAESAESSASAEGSSSTEDPRSSRTEGRKP